MSESKIRELILPDGKKFRGREIELDVISEGWNEYALPDGTKLRLQNSLIRAFQVVDEKGNPVYNAVGEPEILINAVATNVDNRVSNITHEQREDGSSVWYAVHPVSGQRVEIDPEQLWFWSTEWQAGERQVDEQLKQGNYEEFDDIDAFIDSL